jgi:hypothetical protein
MQRSSVHAENLRILHVFIGSVAFLLGQFVFISTIHVYFNKKPAISEKTVISSFIIPSLFTKVKKNPKRRKWRTHGCAVGFHMHFCAKCPLTRRQKCGILKKADGVRSDAIG